MIRYYQPIVLNLAYLNQKIVRGKNMKKFITNFTVLSLLVIMLAASVAADLQVTNVLVGDDRFRASNPRADDLEDRDSFDTKIITLSNNGNAAVNNITVSITEVATFAGKLQITFQNVPTSLGAGDSQAITITARIPENLDAVDKALKEAAFKTADIVFSGNNTTSQIESVTSILTMQRENQLEIDDVEVCVNDRCKTVDDGDDVENIRPGDRMKLTFKVENKYSDNDREDLDIEDVELAFEIDDDEFNEDDDEDMGDISADDDEEVTFSFTVDDDVDDGKVDLEATVEGRDENGARHGEAIEIDLEIERQTHEVNLRRVSALPSRLVCGNFKGRVSVSFVNIGKRDEDETAIELLQTDLGIQERIGLFDLDEDDSRTETIRYELAADTKPGVYSFIVRSFYDSSAQSDEESIDITVPDCSEQEKADEPAQVVVTTPPAQQPAQPTQIAVRNRAIKAPAETTTSTFTDSGVYVALLALAVVVVLGVLVVLIVKFTGKKEPEL